MHDPFLRIGRTCRHCKHLAHHETHAGSDFMSSFASNINLIALAVVGRISNLEQYIQQILVRRGLLCIEDILDSKSTSQLYAVTSLDTNLPPNTKIAKGYPRVHHWYIIGTSLVHHWYIMQIQKDVQKQPVDAASSLNLCQQGIWITLA